MIIALVVLAIVNMVACLVNVLTSSSHLTRAIGLASSSALVAITIVDGDAFQSAIWAVNVAIWVAIVALSDHL